MAEYHAMCSTAEELLHLRTILEHFEFRVNTTLFCDSVAARRIAQRAGLGKVKATGSENVMVARGCSRERLQIKSIVSKANKDDLEACGIVVPGEVSKHTVESETELDPD